MIIADRTTPPLTLKPRASRWLAGYLAAAHALAMVAIAALPIDIRWRLSLGAAVMLGAALAYWTHIARRAPWTIVSASWRGEDWRLTHANGFSRMARLLPGSVIWRSLCVLHFRIGRWRSRTLILVADSLPADDLRRLRMWLRVSGARPASASPASQTDREDTAT